MKNTITYIILAIGFVLFQTSYSQSWESVAEGLLPELYCIYSISVVNDDVIWAVANDRAVEASNVVFHIPRLLKTSDGGETWQMSNINGASGSVVYDIFALDDHTAFLTLDPLSQTGTVKGVLKTDDGGQSWEQKFDDNSGTRYIHFFNEMDGLSLNTGYFSDFQPVALTEDGGETWQSLPMNTVPVLAGEGFGYLTESNFWEVIGDKIWFGSNAGRMFKSEDKGQTWEVYDTPFWLDEDPVVPVLSVAFKDEMNGIALGQDLGSTKFIRTSDGGKTWQSIPFLKQERRLSHIEYVPGTDGTLIGLSNGNVPLPFRATMISEDFGETWELIDQWEAHGDAYFSSITEGWSATGGIQNKGDAAMFQWNNGNSTPVRDEFQSEGLSIYPNPFADRVYISCQEQYNRPELALIYDADGRMIRSEKITSDATEIHLYGLPAGTYCMQLIGKDREWAKHLVKIE